MGEKKILPGVCLLGACLLAALLTGGCRWIRIEEEERTPINYTIVKQSELPEELRRMIEEKKAEDFGMSCRLGEDLYLVRGYGTQMSGGYSIQIDEVSQNSGAVFFYTHLEGPQTPVHRGEPSYPIIVVKTAGSEDLPVEFRETEEKQAER